jgi:hypothetical protein
MSQIAKLRAEGFAPAGQMVLVPRGIMSPDGVPKVPGVYAFVIDNDHVAYVGTSKSLGDRVWKYRYVFDIDYSKPNRLANDEMRKALEGGSTVSVWVCTDVLARLPSGRMISGAHGLESALIAELQPAWNVLGVAPRAQWRGASGDGARKAWATRRAA